MTFGFCIWHMAKGRNSFLIGYKLVKTVSNVVFTICLRFQVSNAKIVFFTLKVKNFSKSKKKTLIDKLTYYFEIK